MEQLGPPRCERVAAEALRAVALLRSARGGSVLAQREGEVGLRGFVVGGWARDVEGVQSVQQQLAVGQARQLTIHVLRDEQLMPIKVGDNRVVGHQVERERFIVAGG
jgi:hypothetical protein